MSLTNTNVAATVLPVAIPLRDLLAPAILCTLLTCLAIYFVGAEQGATSLVSGIYVHELVHDARHLLGFPCH